jgi:hypothetical protein
MRSTRFWPALAICAGLAACSDQPAPTQPSAESDAPAALVTDDPTGRARAQQLERLARRFARALGDPAFRAEVMRALETSPYPEGKVYFQRALARDGDRGYQVLARTSGDALADITADANEVGTLELYLPVPAHRSAWSGDEQVLVATAERDGEAPVAFDPQGRRQVLDARTPPTTPVLAVVPAEVDFDAPRLRSATCYDEACGGGTGGYVAPPTPGLYLTRADFVSEFEGWLKGNPEYEIHIMGPAAPGDTKVIASYQCIGEHAGGAYAWDMNSKSWTGSQLLFSNTQMDAFAATYGGQPFSIMVYEDDDGACRIRTDADRAQKLFAAIGPAVADWTAAIGKKDDLLANAPRIVKAAKSAYSVLTALYSFITSADDIIGLSIEDAVSGRYRAGTNWTVLNDKVGANGWLKLETK